jgi:hypothetical protein
MEKRRLVTISLVVAVLLGFACASFAARLASDETSPAEKQPPVKIKLPKTLYCAMTASQDRYTINLRPLSKALGDPAETWEVQLFRNDHLVTPLGRIGGGMMLDEFIIFTLPPVDADAFNSTTASRAEMAGGSDEQVGQGMGVGQDGRENILRSKTGRSFQLRVLNAVGDLLAKKKVLLILN